jgi:hypothetical protein
MITEFLLEIPLCGRWEYAQAFLPFSSRVKCMKEIGKSCTKLEYVGVHRKKFNRLPCHITKDLKNLCIYLSVQPYNLGKDKTFGLVNNMPVGVCKLNSTFNAEMEKTLVLPRTIRSIDSQYTALQ